ncbi:MAG: HrpE/YscL family type III secretion apparatus protein [Candidatus Competibacteraceae bacterium]|nr:HrpE/YscL family type III secretion apparatus protein [Candidatus Competibacteraceae bacterium]
MDPFVRLTLNKSTLQSDTRILKAADYQVFETAGQVLADAQRRAQDILAQAEQVYEEQKARGYEDGMDEAKQEMAEQMLDTVGRTVDYFAQVEKRVAAVVIAAVRKILGDFDEQELTVGVVRNALQVVRTQKQVTVRVSPGQEQALRERLDEILAGYSGVSYLEIVPDHRLNRGGCILETDIGVVEASVEVQLQALEQAIKARIDDVPG